MAKKTELAMVSARDLQRIEYRGQRVVTTEQLAAGYGATEQMITNNFNRNKSRFVEGKHYFKLSGEDVDILRNSFRGLQISPKARSLTLWTERGAANHAKMLETDQAWNYFNDLTEFYFSYREVTALPSPSELSRLEILKMAIESEEGRLAAEARVEEVTTERNEAIRAKSRISRKREASALGKLSAATRRCRDLEEQLGESTRYATIIKVENATGRKGEFTFTPLRRWCRANGVEAKDIPDERYGSVKSWPAGAWLDAYGIDLRSLFGEKK
ncbi:ORF6N domain-containing protein [Salmonella enterica]|nr:ORF6N domain-containing protein [Salmonella enterica]ELK9790705.1 ORF6N domain-containing protein [Salmonella enterica]ELK9829754.1 ORF6N domain-containing protein [Salmonella enterica]